MDYFFRSFIFQNVFDLRCFRLSCHLSLVSFSVMLRSIMKNKMRILIWKKYVWDYWGPYAQHISRVELTKYANTKLFLRHLNKSKNSEIFSLYKDLTLSKPVYVILFKKGRNRTFSSFPGFHVDGLAWYILRWGKKHNFKPTTYVVKQVYNLFHCIVLYRGVVKTAFLWSGWT